MHEERTPRSPDWGSGKRRQILEGARHVFSELGLDRASMDVIAARSGVSKATLYNHFQDKGALFAACFAEGSERTRGELQALFAEPSDDLEDVLQRAGEWLLAKLLSPDALALQRSSSGAARLPEVGELFFERGIRVIFETFADALSRWAARGLLRLDDPGAAAVQFVALCQGDLIMRVYMGGLPVPPPEEVRATVRRAVQTFRRAFRP